MSFFNIVMSVKQKHLTSGCKRYYEYLTKLYKASSINNWKIINGKYKDYNFVIAKDNYVAKQLGISIQSIYNYKKTLKSLGLIDTLPKFTVKTNKCKNNHFCQLTVILKAIPKWLIRKSLVFCNSIKKARILKTSNKIISQVNQNLNSVVNGIHTKVKKMVNNVKTIKCKTLNLNDENVQTVCNTLNTYNVTFKNYDLSKYIEMYLKSKERFIQTCKYCSNKYMYAPLKYFTKVFEGSKINKFCEFPQREYDFKKLEKLLIEN